MTGNVSVICLLCTCSKLKLSNTMYKIIYNSWLLKAYIYDNGGGGGGGKGSGRMAYCDQLGG